jgi:hypothetical protein
MLVWNQSPLVDLFEIKIRSEEAKSVFEWLDQLSKAGQLPDEIEPLLTDFYFSLR